jgi:uncharacterized damage-inducible protein DinB
MTADEVRTHLRYHGWASRRLLDAALSLSPEDMYRPMNVSHKDVMGTLGHILYADRIWFKRVVDPSTQVQSTSGLPLHESLPVEWPEMQKRWEDWAASLTDGDLHSAVSYKTLKGDPYESPLWNVMLHLVNHGTYHRGQVAAMLKQLGAPLPPTDMIVFYRESN